MDEGRSRGREKLPAERRAAAPELPVREREAVVELLSDAFSRDLLTTEEFELRVAEAYRVETPGDLVAVTHDLPTGEAAPEVGVPAPPGASPPVLASAILSAVDRPGPGTLPQRFVVRAVLGSVELDLRRARFAPGVTEITVKACPAPARRTGPRHGLRARTPLRVSLARGRRTLPPSRATPAR